MPRKTDPAGGHLDPDPDASMRPRPDAAENAFRSRPEAGSHAASMRPRPDAAENEGLPHVLPGMPAGFNEAAARCRGKLRQLRLDAAALAASMRPRPDAAENSLSCARRTARMLQ